MAHTEVALQSQVQHYKKISDELRIQLEQLRRQPQPPPPPPVNTVDTQEIYRLRDEVCVCVCVCVCILVCVGVYLCVLVHGYWGGSFSLSTGVFFLSGPKISCRKTENDRGHSYTHISQRSAFSTGTVQCILIQ